MAVDGLEKSELGSASALFSSVRNVGGAIGIALASQFVVERERLHASRIGEAVTPFSREFRERTVALVRLLTRQQLDPRTVLHGKATEPYRQQALAVMDKLVHHDAQHLAYSDAFLAAGVAMLVCAAGGLLLRKSRP
jgi:DHA2 family multidrug resistance protein